MTKPDADKWLRRIYRVLKELADDEMLKVKLASNLGYYGEVTVGGDGCIMLLNPTRRLFPRTIIHECIHLVDFTLSEKVVRKVEKELSEALSDKQLGNLLKKVCNYL